MPVFFHFLVLKKRGGAAGGGEQRHRVTKIEKKIENCIFGGFIRHELTSLFEAILK